MDYLSENSNFSLDSNSIGYTENDISMQDQPDYVLFENLIDEINYNVVANNNFNTKNYHNEFSNYLNKKIICLQNFENTKRPSTFQNSNYQCSSSSNLRKNKEKFDNQFDFNNTNYLNQRFFKDDMFSQKNYSEPSSSFYNENNSKKFKKTHNQNLNQNYNFYPTNYQTDQFNTKALDKNLNNFNNYYKKDDNIFTVESKENFSSKGFSDSSKNFDFQLETIEIDGKKIDCLQKIDPFNEEKFTTSHPNCKEQKNIDQEKQNNQCLSSDKILIYDLDKKMYFCVEESISYEGTKDKKNLPKKINDKKKFSYTCVYCDRVCQTKSLYDIHLRKHTGERPFICLICNASFPQKSSLTRHNRSHTNEKPYECDACQKKFNDKNTLKIHKRIHTGEKPFFCGVCFRQFTQKASLKRHIKIHESKKDKKKSQ